MIILVDGESKELDSDYLFNRSLCFKEEGEDDDLVLTKSYCDGRYRMFSTAEGCESTWWIKGTAAYTLSSICVA